MAPSWCRGGTSLLPYLGLSEPLTRRLVSCRYRLSTRFSLQSFDSLLLVTVSASHVSTFFLIFYFLIFCGAAVGAASCLGPVSVLRMAIVILVFIFCYFIAKPGSESLGIDPFAQSSFWCLSSLSVCHVVELCSVGKHGLKSCLLSSGLFRLVDTARFPGC